MSIKPEQDAYHRESMEAKTEINLVPLSSQIDAVHHMHVLDKH